MIKNINNKFTIIYTIIFIKSYRIRTKSKKKYSLVKE